VLLLQTTMVTSLWAVFQILLILESVCCVAIPVSRADILPAASPKGHLLLPAEDSFYTPPSGFEEAALGSIIRHRPVPNGITLNNKDPIYPENAWQLLYRTQNSVGEPSVSVVTVIKPFNAKPNHLFSYAMFSVGSISRTRWKRADFRTGLCL
jgi:hypothetical protein